MNPLSLVQKVVAYGLAAALVAALAIAGILWWRLDSVQKDLDACGKVRAELEGRIATQNQAIIDWQQRADEALKSAAVARKKAVDVSAAVKPRVDALQARILAGAGKTCGDALREIRGDQP